MPISKAAAILINLAIVAGGMAVQYLLTPKQQGLASDQGKLDDIRITGSEYGNLIPRVWGRARMGSNVVWSSGIRHRVSTVQTGGGKGATPASATTTHIYTADLGMQICRGPIKAIGRIWADSDIITDTDDTSGMFEAEIATKTGGAADVTSASASGGKYVTFPTDPSAIEFSTSLMASVRRPKNEDPEMFDIAASILSFNYKCTGAVKIKVDCYDEDGGVGTIYSATIDLSSTAGDWLIHQLRITDATKFVGRVKLSKVASTTAPDIDTINLTKIWQSDTSPATTLYTPSSGIKDPYVTIDDTDLNPAKYYNYRPAYSAAGVAVAEGLPANRVIQYLGTTTQPADDVFITWLDTKYGVGNGVDFAMGYREEVMVVLEDYNLRAGRIPNYTFEIIEETSNLKDVFEDILTDCGLTSNDYDLTEIDGIEFTGIVETARQSKKTFLENIGVYYGFRMYEADGKIKFVTDDDFTSVGTISEDILRARPEGGEMKPYDAELLVSPKQELPREVRFNVMNPLLDYHNETITASLYCDMASADSQDFNFPIIDFPDNARYRAEKALLKMYAEGRTVTFSAMPEMLKYALGDVVEMTINEVDLLVRIEKMTIGMPIGTVEIEGTVLERYDPTEIFTTVSEQSATTNAMKPKMINLRNAKLIPIISLPIRGRDKGRLGCYVAVTPIGSGATDNFALYRELGDDNYVIMDILDVPATCGVTDGTLGTHSNATVEDTTNTLDIYFYNVTSLESYTNAELSRYPTLNLIRIGDEWIQFRTAVAQTLPSGSDYRSKWRISNLWRGRFETTTKMATHGAAEDVVLWDDSIRFYDLTKGDIGETVTLKVTTGGQLVEDAKEFNFTFNPVSKYDVKNATADRAYDADCTTMDEISDVLATLIEDSNL